MNSKVSHLMVTADGGLKARVRLVHVHKYVCVRDVKCLK